MTRKIGLGSTHFLRPIMMVSCAISPLLAPAADADLIFVGSRVGSGDAITVLQEFRDASIESQTDGAFRIRLTDRSMPLGLEGTGVSVMENLIEADATANRYSRRVFVQTLASKPPTQSFLARASEMSIYGAKPEEDVLGGHALFSTQHVDVSTAAQQISALARAQADVSQIDLPTSTGMLGSRLSVDGNRIFGRASANIGEVWLALESNTALDVNAALLSVQQNLGTDVHGNALPGMSVLGRAIADFGAAEADQETLISGNVQNSLFSIDTNTVFAQAEVNRADNRISAAGTRIQGKSGFQSGVYLSGVQRNMPATIRSAEADLALLNSQQQSGQVESVASLTAQLDIRIVDGGRGMLIDSSMSLFDALMRSDALANTAINQIMVESVTELNAASASLGNYQQNEGRVVARTNVSDIDGGAALLSRNKDILLLTMEGIERSRVRIDDTVFLANASANRATNLIRMSGTEVQLGRDPAATINTYADTVVSSLSSFAVNADVTLGNLQISKGRADVQSEAALRARIEVGTGPIFHSSLSLSRNFVQSVATDNEATNLVAVRAKNALVGTVGLSNMQLADATAVQADAHLDLMARQMPGDDLSNSRIAFDGNIALSAASGNDAENQILVSGSKIDGQSIKPTPLVLNSPAQKMATANFALSNQQQRSDDAPIEARATLSAAALLAAPSINDSSNLSIYANAVEASSVSNRARNTLRLDADILNATSAVISSTQTSDASVEAVVSLDQLLGNIDLDVAAQLKVIIADNLAIAQARGNDSVNILNAQAAVIAPEEDIPANKTVPLNATGSFAAENTQRNTGGVKAQASAQTDTADVTPSPGGALNSSQIVLRNAGLVADSSGNRSVTQIIMRGPSGSTEVSMSATSSQINTGSVTSTARASKFSNAPAGQIGNRPASASANPVTATATGNSSITQLQRY